MFYSPSNNAFYVEAIHGQRLLPSGQVNSDCKIPPDSVEISGAQHAALLEGQAQGKRIAADAKGSPVLVTPPAPTLVDLKATKNAEINAARLAANRSTFAHADKVFACDELSRSDIDGANGMISNLGALPQGWPGGWKAVDNTYLPIATVAEWKAFYGSMFAAGAANFARAQALKESLAAATTAAQVAAIVW